MASVRACRPRRIHTWCTAAPFRLPARAFFPLSPPHAFDGVSINGRASDAFSFFPVGSGDGIKDRLRIQFVDAHGMEEAGIDGGGLFKEFMHELVKNAFGPTYALFKSTGALSLIHI